MKTFRPRSWSAQARTFADAIYESGMWMVIHGEWNEEQREREMIAHLQNSYRPKIVVYRAAKRLYKKGR
jgi:hypothetical protein